MLGTARAPRPSLRGWATIGTGPFDFGPRAPIATAPDAEVQPFVEWLEAVSPQWSWRWKHQRLIQTALDDVTSGVCKRLLVIMPPRHTKTEHTSVRYPVYRMASNPALKVILGAYNQTYAEKISRKARRVAIAAGVGLSTERNAAEEWETLAGGGMRAAGVGAGVTGMGADLIVIDDPVKSRAEAESLAYREKCWEWYTDDIYSRRDSAECGIVVTMTRWHEDDLAGRILASEDGPNWRVLHMKAVIETEADRLADIMGRAIGDVLWPEKITAEMIAESRRVSTPYSFSALYQGDPTPREGRMFPRELAPVVDAVPSEARHARGWDKAGTDGDGDYSAGVRLATHDGVWYVVDVARGRVAASARKKMMRQTAELDTNAVRIYIEQEPGSGGKDSAADDIRLLAGFAAYADPSTGDKVTRAYSFAAQWQAGNVRIVRGGWNKAYLDELDSFPRAAHDDQVDASSLAFNKLAGTVNFWVS